MFPLHTDTCLSAYLIINSIFKPFINKTYSAIFQRRLCKGSLLLVSYSADVFMYLNFLHHLALSSKPIKDSSNKKHGHSQMT